jgi:outer membrane protein assembly factor BamB
MLTGWLRVSVFILLSFLILLGTTAWGGVINKDRDWQILQKRLCECKAEQEVVLPMIKDGVKAGGDLIWWFQGIENVECVSPFVDVDGDGLPDVLVESYDAGAPQQDHFFCIKGNSPGYGTVLWSCRPPGGPSNSGGYGDQCVSYVDDVNGDGHEDALLGTAWGGRTAYAINGTNGGVIWAYDTYAHPPEGWVYSICSIEDLNGDSIPEVLFGIGSDGDAAFCVDGTNGDVIWKFQANDAVFAVAELEDINGDGKNEALIGTGDPYEDRVVCISGSSSGSATLRWQIHLGASVHDVSAIEDVNGDSIQDVLVAVWDGYVYCRNGYNGTHIWSYPIPGLEYPMRVVPIDDIDEDEIQDVLVGSWKNAVICLSGADGSLVCSYPTGTLNGGDVWSVDAIGDLNGDGYSEALGSSFDKKVYCVDLRRCDTLWTYTTGNRVLTVRGLPDVTGECVPDALAGTQMLYGQPGGKAFCISGGIPFWQRGDANFDGTVDAADIVYLLNYLYRNDDPPPNSCAGDVNADGEIGPGDIVYLINYLFRNGDPPPPPVG